MNSRPQMAYLLPPFMLGTGASTPFKSRKVPKLSSWTFFSKKGQRVPNNLGHVTLLQVDGKFYQPHRMAPDQTIRLVESNFDICDGHIRFFPAFPMEIFDQFEVFRLYFLSKGWKSSTFWNFPIIFPFQRMEILDISKFSDYIPFSKDGNSNEENAQMLLIYSTYWKVYQEKISLRQKKMTRDKVWIQFYYASTVL